MYLFLQYGSLSYPTFLPASSPFSGGGGRFPYGSHRGQADAYCQAGVSSPAWSLAGQDRRWASQPRHTAGGHIHPCVSVIVNRGESGSCSGVPTYVSCHSFPSSSTHTLDPLWCCRVLVFLLPVKEGGQRRTQGIGKGWRTQSGLENGI